MTTEKKLSLAHQSSSKHRLTNEVLAPDDVPIHVDWGKFVVGASLFVPAINTSKLKTQMNMLAMQKGWRITPVERIEYGQWGVRFWRLL